MFPSLLSKRTRPQDSELTARQALCHCADCRKISGGNYSNNFLVPSEKFKVVEGTPKKISKIADTGKEITVSPLLICVYCTYSLSRRPDFPLYRVLAEFAPRNPAAHFRESSSKHILIRHSEQLLWRLWDNTVPIWRNLWWH
jgi:hypothetical protein